MTDFTTKCPKCEEGIMVAHNMGDSINLYCPKCNFAHNLWTSKDLQEFTARVEELEN